MVGAYERPLSLSTMVTLHSEWPRLFSPSNAMPPVIEPSPITATTWRSLWPCALQRGGEAVRVAEHGRRVAVLDPVVFGFGAARVARQPAVLAQRTEVVVAAGDQLVHVRLVADVPQNDVAGRGEHTMQGQRQLDDTEVGPEVTLADCRNGADDAPGAAHRPR